MLERTNISECRQPQKDLISVPVGWLGQSYGGTTEISNAEQVLQYFNYNHLDNYPLP